MYPLYNQPNIENAGLAELYRQHAPALLTHLRMHMGSLEDAEDILLDVFLAALERESLCALSEQEQRYWLWRVARNKMVDHYRKTLRRQHISLDEVAETLYADEVGAPEFAALQYEEFGDLYKAIRHLSPIQQELILLRFMHNMRVPEIARLVEKSEAAVRMMLSRTLNLLRGFYWKHQREKR